MKTNTPIYWPVTRPVAIVIAGGGLIWVAVIWWIARAWMRS